MLRPALNNPQWARQDQLLSSLLLAVLLHIVLLGVNGLWPQASAPSVVPAAELLADVASPVAELPIEAGIVTRASSGNQLPGDSQSSGLNGELGIAKNPIASSAEQALPLALADAAAPSQLLQRQSPLKVYYSASQQPFQEPFLGRQALTQLSATATSKSGDVSDDAAEDEQTTVMAEPKRLSLGAASREDIALKYVEGWRRWMRANGNLFYPAEARRLGLRGEVLTEVRLNSDGSLADVRILRSSGQRLLDQAVLQTTKEARWYLPFPPELAKRYDQLEFSWRWRYGAAPSAQ